MGFFNPEKQPWRFLARAVDFVGLSLCCALTSLPVVTLGPSLSALYYATVKTFRYGDETAFKTYFSSFRKNFKDGVILTLISIPFILFFAYGYAIMKDHSSTREGAFLFTFYYVLLFIPFSTFLNMFPLLARFDMRKRDIVKTAFEMTIAHLPSSFVIVLLSIELTVWTIEKWYPVFLSPAIWALFSSFFLEKNYKKHLGEEECASLEGLTLEEYREKEEKRKLKGKK